MATQTSDPEQAALAEVILMWLRGECKDIKLGKAFDKLAAGPVEVGT